MRATVNMFWILTAFCVAAWVTYIVWNLSDPGFSGGQLEPVGTVALLLVAGLCGLISTFLTLQYRAQKGQKLPEDRQDADIDDGEAEQGFFSPWSWWPVTLGAAAALMFTGLAVGNWLCFIAVPLAGIAIVGLIFEYQRGYFGH